MVGKGGGEHGFGKMKLPPLKRVGFSQEMLSFIAIALDQSLEFPSRPYGLAGRPFAIFELSLIVCMCQDLTAVNTWKSQLLKEVQ